jgi:D-sedoheptulose 7-phosphate isomerase
MIGQRSAVVTAAEALIDSSMEARNRASEVFFAREAESLALLCRRMSDRFQRGGRLLAFGSGCWASDAQHVAVEFVHPVLAGKRALPAVDLSQAYRASVPVLVRAEDIVIGFGPPGGDPQVDIAIRDAMARGALCIALPGAAGDYAIAAPSDDPFIHQEILETLYHTLWESVHVFFERQTIAHDAGTAAFLYPFLGGAPQDNADTVQDVAASIRSKAQIVDELRRQTAVEQGAALVDAALAIRDRLDRGATVLCFGNGGSATDATDMTMDLVASPKGHPPIPALSLAAEPATLTALANDIGPEAIFLRQLIAYGRPQDVAVAISTSGGSSNIAAALIGARARGLLTVALLGYDGGEIVRRGLADHALVVRSDQIPRVQEVQASIYHVLLDVLHAIGCGR